MENQPELKLNPQTMPKLYAERCNDILRQISTCPASGGKNALIKLYGGIPISKREAILAKCCDCSGYYVDGKVDCEVPWCSLYPHMPYGKMRKKHYIRPERRKQVNQ